jgi:sugar/nucleoside kinase (ribokinase family)
MKKEIKTLFVGLNTVDMQFFVDGFPKSNSKTKANGNEITAGGPATNAAIASALLGAKTTLITPIGKHSLSRFLMEDITNYNVEVIDPIEQINSEPIFASIITDEINGERTIFSYHPENNHEKLLEGINLQELDTYQIAMFDGFYPDLAIPLAKTLRKMGITTVLDGGSWKTGLSKLLPFIDIAICSNDFYLPNTKTHTEVFSELKKYGVMKIAITRGTQSILYLEGEEIQEVRVAASNVVDTLGAGDFFHGAFCYYYAIRPNFKEVLAKASEVAAFSCNYRGTRKWMKHFNETLV